MPDRPPERGHPAFHGSGRDALALLEKVVRLYQRGAHAAAQQGLHREEVALFAKIAVRCTIKVSSHFPTTSRLTISQRSPRGRVHFRRPTTKSHFGVPLTCGMPFPQCNICATSSHCYRYRARSMTVFLSFGPATASFRTEYGQLSASLIPAQIVHNSRWGNHFRQRSFFASHRQGSHAMPTGVRSTKIKNSARMKPAKP